MPEAVLLAFALLSSVVGLAWLALSMDVHWRQVRGDRQLAPAVTKLLRVLGSVALVISLLLSFAADHASMAALVWIMDLAAAALIVAFTFTWRPRCFAPLVGWVGGKR